MLVPNQFPLYSNPALRLAIVGEAPGADEAGNLDAKGQADPKPFVGSGGRLLKGVLGSYKIAADQVFLGNVCQHHPPKNDIDSFEWDGYEIQSGIEQLKNDLAKFKPHCVLLAGRAGLRAFHPEVCYHDKGEYVSPIGDYRGSILKSSIFGYKTVSTFHPSYVLRSYGELPLFKFDVLRGINQAESGELPNHARTVVTRPTLTQVIDYCNEIRLHQRRIGLDVEGYNDNVGITCFSFAVRKDYVMVFPLWLKGSNGHDDHYWAAHEEPIFWEAIAGVLSDPNVPKVVQSATYEMFIFAWKHKLIIQNIDEDTMLKHWELFPEFPKSLALQTSIYTEEPFYKNERVSSDEEVKLLYNAKDSAVTVECCDAEELLLKQQPRSQAHYRFNISLLPSINYMHLRGCRLSKTKIEENITKTVAEIQRLGGDANLIKKTKKNENSLTGGELGALVGRPINAKSTDDKKWLLYDLLGYKPYAAFGESTEETVLHKYYARDRNPAVKLLIQLVSVRTRKSDIEKLSTNEDGRIRSNYNLAGTNTARLNSSASNALIAYFTKTGKLKWDQTGTNLQNVTEELRECFIADDGMDFWNYDLAGADAWTVGADLAALGNPTMLDDLLAGIKPAKVLLLMLEEYEAGRNPAAINNLPRAELAARTKAYIIPSGRDELGRPGGWKYLCMKRVQHGTAYGMEPDKLSLTIFKDSEGTIDLTNKEAGIYQYLFKLRYNTDARRTWIEKELRDKGILRTASGFQRKFYGLRYGAPLDQQVVREALAFEPQANTTYLTNLAMQRLWYDEQNRTSKGALFIEPILQVHDALSGQWGQRYRSWAIEKTKEYFNNTLVIHGIDIKIPADGGYGPDWGHTKSNPIT